ncbi:MAG: DUF4091 domain-containing protein [Lachnospirales bacterium]
MFETRLVSSLVKIFPNDELKAECLNKTSALMGDVVYFQLAVKSEELAHNVEVTVLSNINEHIEIGYVGLVPSMLPNYGDHDEYLLKTEAGLFPDPIYQTNKISMVNGQWNSFWVTIKTSDLKADKYEIILNVNYNNDKVAEEVFTLNLLNVKVSNSSLKHTEWFYFDCIADFHKTEMLSDEHFEIIGKYIDNYVEHGINMILTPLFSPALEMKVNGDRPTVQLVKIFKENEDYYYDFDLLDRFMTICLEKDIKYFEMTHLFSQWGAEYAPKIYAEVDGEQRKIFGWHTRADSDEYKNFLKSFLEALHIFLKKKNLENICYFHISDEPNMSNIEHYKVARDIIKEIGWNVPIFDALSDFEFYERGLVDIPVASTEHISKFLNKDIKNLWAYYCCCEYKNGLSNRFMSMPSLRTRIIGLQLYKAKVEGFLHWGYNHWYGHKCLNMDINPYLNTDADRGFPSGDAFLVYPGKSGPVSSIRLKLLHQAFQDADACRTLENLVGRKAVIDLLDEEIQIDFENYPKSEKWLLNLREKINYEIFENKQKINSNNNVIGVER